MRAVRVQEDLENLVCPGAQPFALCYPHTAYTHSLTHPSPRAQEKPEGIIVQFGGQTPLKIATTLETYLNEFKIPNATGAPRLLEGEWACVDRGREQGCLVLRTCSV